MGEEHEKEAKGRFGFKKTEEENHTQTSKESRGKSWSSSGHNTKETDPQDNM